MNKKAVLITGATGAIGPYIAETLAGDGYNIIMADIVTEDKAETVIKNCKNKGADVFFVQTDVSSYSSCEEAVKQAAEKYGGIYGLINNAGIIKDSLLMRMTEEQWDKVINVNLKSMFNMSKNVVPHMVKAKEGRIVNMSSVAGVYGNAGQTNYSSSKAGIIGFTKSLAKEVGSRGITVNAVAPGFIDSGMTETLKENALEEIKSRIPLRIAGTPQDVANAVSFLISDKASYITAHVLSVDGGMSL